MRRCSHRFIFAATRCEAALGTVEAGKIVAIYKVSGQRRVLAVIDVESPDELDQIIWGASR